jgi:catechol 2,3-dioxygenase-like lactoylglutathione lyase family enzyme
MSSARVHVALNTNRFDESVNFYRQFLGEDPVKLKPGYAKFDLPRPGLNLTLNETTKVPDATSSLNHLGLQVDTTKEVMDAAKRLEDAGLATFEEADTVCCYALQDKVWVTDPSGHRWEVFVVKEQDVTADGTNEMSHAEAMGGKAGAEGEDCCAPTCCS